MSSDETVSGDSTDEAYSFVEHTQSQQQRDDYWDRNEDIREQIRKCARALQRGQRRHYHYIAQTLQDTLVPRLLSEASQQPEDYDDTLHDHIDWSFGALTSFVERPGVFVAAVAPHNDYAAAGQALLSRGAGFEGGEVAARDTIEGAFRSCAAIAEEEEIIRTELRTRVAATMFGLKLGEHIQDAEQDLGAEVEAISLASGALKTVHTGGTGQGKSAGLETEGEGYYYQNYREGRNYKLIDHVGLRDGENWFYDIPQHDETMRSSREEQGLPPSFAEDDDRPPEEYPEIEILVPLTPGLMGRELPFDTDDERFTVRPFTIAAADIRERLLISILTTTLTPEQENIVRNAYKRVARRGDWALVDLADEILGREELSDAKKQPIVDTLANLQRQGFIRTRKDDHTLDWDRIFADTETITVFSQAFVDDDLAQYISVGHISEQVVKERERRYGIAPTVLLAREMWKIAPHNRRQSFDGPTAALQEAIGHMFTELFRENRHSGVHLDCDTQYLSDLLKPIRELFNRYVVYNTNRDTVKDVFEWTANDKWGSFYSTLSPKPGEASVVGMVQPAIDERGIEFIGPVDFAGPSHHHFEEEVDHNGWKARAEYLTPVEVCEECDAETLERDDSLAFVMCEACGHEMRDLSLGREEVLRTPAEMGREWDDEVPTRLMIQNPAAEDNSGPDPDRKPVHAFAEKCLTFDSAASVRREDVRVAFNEWMVEHDRSRRDFDSQSVVTKFGKRLAKALDNWDDITQTAIDGDVAYNNLRLTDAGDAYVDDAMEGLESSAAPIAD